MMDIPLAEIDWSVLLVSRLATIMIVILFVFQMSLMLSHYWWRIIPLRREMGADTKVLAPPVGWTFAYHLLVTIIFTIVGIGVAQAAYFESPGTVFSYVAPFLTLALTVVVNRFTKYYFRDINRVYRDHFRR